MRPDRRSGAGLVQQTVQIAAALRLRDLTLVVRLHDLQARPLRSIRDPQERGRKRTVDMPQYATALIPAALHSDCRVFPRSVNFFECENRPATHSIDVFDHSNRVVLETPVKLILGFSASCRRCIDGFKRSNDHFRCDQGLTVVGNRFRWNSDERPLIMLCDMVSPSNFGDGDCTTSLQLTAIKLLKRDHGVIEPKFLVLDNAPAVYIEAERYRRVVESIARRLISEAPNIKGRALAKRFADISQDVASGDVEPYVLTSIRKPEKTKVFSSCSPGSFRTQDRVRK